MMRSKIKKLLLCAGVTLMAASCVTDDVENNPVGRSGGPGTVRFTLALPGHSVPKPSARALTEAQENAIGNVDVLAFFTSGDNAGKLAYHKAGKVVSGTTFDVELPKGNYDLMMVGNASSAVHGAGLVPRTTTKAAAIAALKVSTVTPHKWDKATIPVWGYKDAVEVNGETSLTGGNAIDMHRMLARIDVQLSKMAASGTENGDGNANFALTEVYLVNYNTVGQIAPNYADTSVWDADGGVVNQGKGIAVAPSLPAAPAKQTGMAAADPWAPAQVYKAVDGLTPSAVTRIIYTVEAENGDENSHDTNPCIVIGGKYDESANTTYYRLDFITKGGTQQAPTYTYLDLLRNHHYTIAISKVSGPGYDTPKEAFDANSFNMEADVMRWEDSDMIEAGFDGQYTLAVSQNSYEFEYGGGTLPLTIRTDYPKGWTAKVCNDAGVELTGADKWVTTDPSAGSTAGESNINISASNYTNTTTDRTVYIHITAGRITLKVKVTQKKAPALGIRSVDGVIGYYANGDKKGQLTLEGDDGDDIDIIYVAYFKWGSLIATSSQNNGPFTSADIVAAKGFAGNGDDAAALATIRAHVGTGTSQEQWDNIPYGDLDGPSIRTPVVWPDTDGPAGIGDACTHYFGDWKVPTDDDNTNFIGRPGTSNNGTSYSGNIYYRWSVTGSASATNPGMAIFPMGTARGASLPAAGLRETNGGTTGRGTFGFYWSSTASHMNNTELFGVHIQFYNLAGFASFTSPYSRGLSVRCMQLPKLSVSSDSLTFDWNATTAQTVNVTSNGPWSVSPITSEINATNFIITLTTPGTVDNNWSGAFTVVPRTTNSGTAPRNINITVTATGSNPKFTKTVKVTQQTPPAPVGGVHASPGMIGYKANGELTLKGSSLYSVNQEIAQYATTEFGGLENEPVYVAYFKFGSLVAMSSDPTDSLDVAGSYLQRDDIIAAPDEWKGSLEGARNFIGTTWGNIPVYSAEDYSFEIGGVYTKRDISDPSYQTPATGKGDPCMYYFGEGWRLQKTSDYGGSGYDYRTIIWKDENVLGPGILTGILMGHVTGNYFPAAGSRNYTTGRVINQGTSGRYWGSTAYETYAYDLQFSSGSVYPHYSSLQGTGSPIRCLRP